MTDFALVNSLTVEDAAPTTAQFRINNICQVPGSDPLGKWFVYSALRVSDAGGSNDHAILRTLCVTSDGRLVKGNDGSVVGHHAQLVTCLAINNSGICVSTSFDGTLKLWVVDQLKLGSATPLVVVHMTSATEDAECWSCAISDTTIAASLDHVIHLININDLKSHFGRETSIENVSHNSFEFHSSRVTSLKFHPIAQSLLISGGEDNLVCVTDTQAIPKRRTSSESDVSDALIGTIGVEDGIRSLEIVGPNHDVLVCFSDTEYLSAWRASFLSGESSLREMEEFEQLISPSGEIRNSPQLASEDSVGYLVQPFYEEPSQMLYVLAASGWGRLILYACNRNTCVPCCYFGPDGVAHSEQIRAAAFIRDFGSVVVITGGDDGKLCLWKQS